MEGLSIDFPSLHHFLKCPKRSVAEDVISKCFIYRTTGFPPEEIAMFKDLFEIAQDEVVAVSFFALAGVFLIVFVDLFSPFRLIPQLFTALISLIKTVIFYQYSSDKAIADLFPPDFHSQLKTLLSTILAAKFPEWNDTTLASHLSLPRFQSLNWKFGLRHSVILFACIFLSFFSSHSPLSIHLKASSTGEAHVTIPTAMVKIQVSHLSTLSVSESSCFCIYSPCCFIG
jgi:hypothetical protein